MIPPRHADRLLGSIIALVVLAIGFRVGTEVWRHYHPVARVPVEEVVPVVVVDTTICKYIPEHVGCGGARK